VRVPCTIQLQSQSSAGDLRDITVVEGQKNGKFSHSSHTGRAVGSKLCNDGVVCDTSKTDI